jgi:hypothetical protein
MLLFVVGLCFTAAGGWLIRQDRRLSGAGQRVTGVVVDLRWRSSGGDVGTGVTRICHPVLEFRTADGQVVRAETRHGSSRVLVRPGEQVPVIFDPANPAHAEIDDKNHRAIWLPVVLVVAGLAISAFAVYH